jgi:hypothetical protein
MTRIEVPGNSRARSGSRGIRIAVILLLLVIGGAAFWTWLTLAWAYSDGERAGVVQKFSRKGWICKTQEGELAQYVVAGVSPQIWMFSVRDPAVGEQLRKAVGQRVQLHYTEHPGVPTGCFAETRYFVDSVTIQGDAPGVFPSPGAGSSPAATAPPPAGAPPAAPAAPAPATNPGAPPSPSPPSP